ncbi:MAG: hypothetical protein ACXABY_15250, partial [Candidatus Thorarchaeota archaeon]
MQKIVGALLARDEGGPDRYLERCVRHALTLCDSVVCLDDGSTDNTVEVLEGIEGVEITLGANLDGFWGTDETSRRAKLWDLAVEAAGPDGRILIFDADMELVGITREDLQTLCKTTIYNSFAMPLWDCWDSDQQHRVDTYWIGWRVPRVWLFKAPDPGWKADWGDTKQIHSGHAPVNYPIVAGRLPGLAAWRHLGYIQSQARLDKAKQYVSLGDKLTDQEMAHAASITDPAPTLVPTPPEYVTKILVGVPTRKPPVVVNALLQTLAWQRFRDKVQLDYLFIDNFADSDPFAYESKELIDTFDGRVERIDNPGNDYGDGDTNRQWSKPAFERMAYIKNSIIQECLTGDYDYLYLLDADVLCEPYTLQSLLDTADHERFLANPTVPLPIVSGVYWTQWQWWHPESTDNVHAGPQVWLRHPYQLHGRGWTETDFRAALVNRQRVQVWGLGACTLIPRQALEKGVGFHHFEGLPRGPMSEGEDRHFCARAEALHIKMVADSWPDIYHAYHPQEYSQISEQLFGLERTQQREVGYTDLVSAKIEVLDP